MEKFTISTCSYRFVLTRWNIHNIFIYVIIYIAMVGDRFRNTQVQTINRKYLSIVNFTFAAFESAFIPRSVPY